jgi:hypothetical protein
MKGLAVVYRRTLEVSLHDQADEADQEQDEHRRGRDQRNRQDRTSDLSFDWFRRQWRFSNRQTDRSFARLPPGRRTDSPMSRKGAGERPQVTR